MELYSTGHTKDKPPAEKQHKESRYIVRVNCVSVVMKHGRGALRQWIEAVIISIRFGKSKKL